jgi:hypothetical protein
MVDWYLLAPEMFFSYFTVRYCLVLISICLALLLKFCVLKTLFHHMGLSCNLSYNRMRKEGGCYILQLLVSIW